MQLDYGYRVLNWGSISKTFGQLTVQDCQDFINMVLTSKQKGYFMLCDRFLDLVCKHDTWVLIRIRPRVPIFL